MSEITLNNEQRLYVIKCDAGFTCLGFDVCENLSRALAEWILDNSDGSIPAEQPAGTLAAYSRYRELCSIAEELCRNLHVRCNIQLTDQLIGMEGQRVEVVDKYGQKRRFIVGKSTGWMPVHLEIAKRSSRGGPAVTGAPFKTVRVV